MLMLLQEPFWNCGIRGLYNPKFILAGTQTQKNEVMFCKLAEGRNFSFVVVISGETQKFSSVLKPPVAMKSYRI